MVMAKGDHEIVERLRARFSLIVGMPPIGGPPYTDASAAKRLQEFAQMWPQSLDNGKQRPLETIEGWKRPSADSIKFYKGFLEYDVGLPMIVFVSTML